MADIVTELSGGTFWITLNRPDARNALSRAVNLELAQIAGNVPSEARAVVITGAGEKAFCAGADLKERKGVPASESGPYINAIAGAINAVGAMKKPTICMMNGSAYGGGLELALACDFRILVEGAEVGLTEVKLGIMPGAGGTVRLTRLVGEARAKEMILLGRRVHAADALRFGVVNQVVPRAGLRAAADALLAELSACAPLSVTQAKAAIEGGHALAVDAALAFERTCYDVTLFSEDRNEGLAAFAEGRAPQYKGR